VRNGWVHQTKSMNIRKKAHEQLDYDSQHERESPTALPEDIVIRFT
jgi:hypothetical protein